MSAILLKDLRESSFPIMVAVVAGLIYLANRLYRALTLGLSLSEAWTDFVLFALTPTAILIAQRLVQREVQYGWPLLRQHPVRLGRLYVAKLLLGAVLLGVPLGLGALLHRGAVALLELGPGVYDPVPGGTPIFLGLVAGLATLVAVLGRHAWTAGLGVVVLLPHVATEAPTHPLRLARADLALEGAAGGAAWGVVVGLFALAGVAFAGFGGRGPAHWRGRWTWVDRGAFLVVGALALDGLPAPTVDLPLRGEVLGDAQLCVRDLRRAPEASGQVASLASAALGLLPPELTPPQVAIEHGGGASLEVSPTRERVLARVDFLAGFDPSALQRDLLHAALDRLEPAPRGGWALLRDGYPGWALAGEAPDEASARAACALLAAEGLLAGAWTERWGEVRRRLGDPAARALATWLLSRAQPSDLPALLARWGQPFRQAWASGGFTQDLAAFEAGAREVRAEHRAFRAPAWSWDPERRLVLEPPAEPGTLVVYSAPCQDPERIPLVYDRVEGPTDLDPWRTGPLDRGRRWLGFGLRTAEGERFAGWQVVVVP
ncbi:MAG: hypothetical protein R3F62_17490 [Planctomycetota bacterium]